MIYSLTKASLTPPESYCNIPCAKTPTEYCGGYRPDLFLAPQYQNVYLLRARTNTPASTTTSSQLQTGTAAPYCRLGCYSDGDTFYPGGLNYAPLFPILPTLGVVVDATADLVVDTISFQPTVDACLNFCSTGGAQLAVGANGQLDSTYVGVEYNPLFLPTCYCGSQIAPTNNYALVNDSYCNYPCPYGSQETCGGYNGSAGAPTQYYVELYQAGSCNISSTCMSPIRN